MGSDAHSVPDSRTDAGRDGLAALLARPEDAVIALDFDGTLAPIVDDPEQARAHPGAVPALVRLAPLVRSVAVLTGRPAEVAVRSGGFAGVPGLGHLVVLGHYGAERWEAATGEVRAPAAPPGVAAATAELPDVLARTAAGRDTYIEDKGRAVAVHTRRAADPQGALDALWEPLARLAERNSLIVEPGKFVLELRPPGMDKGAALTGHVRAAGAGAVLFAGDDLGDLAAFGAVEALRAEGVPGVRVCSAARGSAGTGTPPELAAQADLLVDGPDGVVGLLNALADRLGAP
ncbi:trehalose-phosphatase [Streptomyces meridianus]|uniref:Trehalose 6-phosphate phosphatase n=1 Tax=Streptomyces meridianus TaxID=2938945 RepID=A0ABT0X4I3_9ACTN|nr:trehalose-phosphatase [Streptomyces meridianus]MCM2577245.1 trehalose-phosphatase [Streptomyces meridianus]